MNKLTVLLGISQRALEFSNEVHMSLQVAFAMAKLLVECLDHNLLLFNRLGLLLQLDCRLGVSRVETVGTERCALSQ